jgi:hypothetical protein
MESPERLVSRVADNYPKEVPDVIEWAEENVRFPQSALSERFNASLTPWIIDPIRAMCMRPEVRRASLCKPVQTAGSAAGEVAILYRIVFGRGFVQYNWSNDKRAEDRWASRIEDILDACYPVAKKIKELPIHKYSKGEVDFGNVFFRMQGAKVSSNLDSDSVHFQVNEELHDWEPGHLQKARNRGTAIWNYKSCDISNASKAGDQFDQACRSGTRRLWEVKCPGCGLFHYMRTRWDKNHPELGGLRYDSTGCKRKDGSYDYLKLSGTIFFQMPCGYHVPYDIVARRRLSAGARYSEPAQSGQIAGGIHESYTYEAVTTDIVDWLQLIQEKHDALRALRRGDPEPWKKYRVERECIFYDPNDLPSANPIVLSRGVKKNRTGLPAPRLRLFSLDYQRGVEDEFPHWWVVIRDVVETDDGKLKTQLVFEGKKDSDESVIQVLDEHECLRWQGVADSGYDATHVYAFCLRYGINCVKGSGEEWYAHPGPDGKGGVKRVYEVERPLHAMINQPPKYAYMNMGGRLFPDPREPLFWRYSKQGIRERLHFLVNRTDWIVPDDVSDDYRSHWSSEERVTREHPRTGETIYEWHQLKPRNDLRVCEAYIAMQIDQAGKIKDQQNGLKTTTDTGDVLGGSQQAG